MVAANRHTAIWRLPRENVSEEGEGHPSPLRLGITAAHSRIATGAIHTASEQLTRLVGILILHRPAVERDGDITARGSERKRAREREKERGAGGRDYCVLRVGAYRLAI